MRLCLVLSACLIIPVLASAAVIEVSTSDSIQAAIDGATSGDTIQLAAGVYVERIDYGGKQLIIQGAPLVGGVPQTALDGDGAGPVVTISGGLGRDTVLERVRVFNGACVEGGGVYVNNASPTIRDCEIIGNAAEKNGGGIYALQSSLLLVKCLVDSNATTGSLGTGGGGLHCRYGAPAVRDCVFTSNTSRARGGAIVAYDCAGLSIRDNLIQGNTSSIQGIGIWSARNTGSVVGNRILDNHQLGTASVVGGGICSEIQDAIDIYGNVIARNEADAGSAVNIYDQCTTSLRSNLIADNINDYYQGSGYWNPSGTGAVRIINSTCLVTGNTVVNNVGHSTSVGLWCYWGSNVTLRNNIVAFNQGAGIRVSDGGVGLPTFNCVYGNVGGNYNGLTDATGTEGNISINPQFADVAGGDYHLKSCNGRYKLGVWVKDDLTSACIDAGRGSDPRGNEPLPNGNRVNMGAYGNTSEASKTSLISYRYPGAGTTGFPRHRPIAITFCKPVNEASVESRLTVRPSGSKPLSGAITWVVPRKRLEFLPDAPLAADTDYIVNLATGIERVVGPAYDWSEFWRFSTGSGPAVIAQSPSSTTTSVTEIRATFDQPMARTSVQSNFSVSPAIAGTFSWSGSTLIYTLTEAAGATEFTVTIGASAKSLAGVKLGWPHSWSFRVRELIAQPLTLTASAVGRGQVSSLALNLSAPATVSARIMNLAGREVAVLPEQQLQAGLSTLLWDGRSAHGTRVPPGRYLVRVEALGAEGAKATVLCPLQR